MTEASEAGPVSVDRSVLLSLFERVTWMDRLYGLAEDIWQSWPAEVRERIQTKRVDPSLFDTEVAVSMANGSPVHRQELHGQIRDWCRLLERTLAGRRGGKLVGNVSLTTITGVVRVLEHYGTKSLREVNRFIEAFDGQDTGYLVIKCAQGKSEAAFTSNISAEIAEQIGLKHI